MVQAHRRRSYKCKGSSKSKQAKAVIKTVVQTGSREAGRGGRVSIQEAFKEEHRDSEILDFDARVPVPVSFFPSTYRNQPAPGEQTTEVKEERFNLSLGREGKESKYSSYTAALPPRDRRYQEDVRVYEEDRQRRPDRREEHIHIHEQDRYTRDPRDTAETRVEIDRER
ncbi:hypothetical protein LTR28_006668 [Elasticomyces elasticus]|nr:hypothetical protein LTR28_006668 [Elasticomyces elasticus]